MTTFPSVYHVRNAKVALYELLAERKPWQNISHTKMPTWREHCDFVHSHPYEGWFLIEDGGVTRGSVYFTDRREIGIFIFEKYAGMGYGRQAVEFIEEKYGPPIHANISIRNAQSVAFFVGLGYEFLQLTLRKSSSDSGSGNGAPGIH